MLIDEHWFSVRAILKKKLHILSLRPSPKMDPSPALSSPSPHRPSVTKLYHLHLPRPPALTTFRHYAQPFPITVEIKTNGSVDPGLSLGLLDWAVEWAAIANMPSEYGVWAERGCRDPSEHLNLPLGAAPKAGLRKAVSSASEQIH